MDVKQKQGRTIAGEGTRRMLRGSGEGRVRHYRATSKPGKKVSGTPAKKEGNIGKKELIQERVGVRGNCWTREESNNYGGLVACRLCESGEEGPAQEKLVWIKKKKGSELEHLHADQEKRKSQGPGGRFRAPLRIEIFLKRMGADRPNGGQSPQGKKTEACKRISARPGWTAVANGASRKKTPAVGNGKKK